MREGAEGGKRPEAALHVLHTHLLRTKETRGRGVSCIRPKTTHVALQ